MPRAQGVPYFDTGEQLAEVERRDDATARRAGVGYQILVNSQKAAPVPAP